MSKVWTVYLIRCTLNGLGYVGATSLPLWKRWSGHLNHVNNGSPHRDPLVTEVIRRYGAQHFTIEPIATHDSAALAHDCERANIRRLKTLAPFGLNTVDGGSGTPGVFRGRKFRERLRQMMIGRYVSPETCERISKAKKGTIISAETRAKISLANKGRKLTPEHRERIRTGNSGLKRSDETKARISASKKGRIASIEERATLAAAQTRRWAKQRDMNYLAQMARAA